MIASKVATTLFSLAVLGRKERHSDPRARTCARTRG